LTALQTAVETLHCTDTHRPLYNQLHRQSIPLFLPDTLSRSIDTGA